MKSFILKFCSLVLVSILPFGLFGQISVAEFMQIKDSSISFDTVATSILSVKKKEGKFGLINALGEWVVLPQYEVLGNIHSESYKPYRPEWKKGILKVSKSGKFGAINCFGKEVIPCIYQRDLSFRNGLFYLQDNTGKYALADRNGKMLTKYTTTYPSAFQYGLKQVDLNKKYNNTGSSTQNYAFINKKGDTLLKLRNVEYMFSILGSSEGMTAFVMYPLVYGDGGPTQGGIGFLDEKGEIAIPPVYSSKHLKTMEVSAEWWDYKPAFHHGLALVLKSDSVIYIDKTGKEMISFKDRPGEIDARDNFNVNGFAQIKYYFKENGRSLRYTEIIDTTGAVVLQIKNEGHIGEGGIEFEFSHYEKAKYFTVIEPEGKTLYNSKLEKLLFIPLSDENYHYFSRSNEAGTCLVREDKNTKKAEYTYLDDRGKQLYPYRSVDIYFDPLTDITISMNGNLLEMKNVSDEVIYSCDSCLSSDFDGLKNYHTMLYYNLSGVYEIHKGDQVLFVNYKGIVMDEFASRKDVVTYFSNLSQERKAYKTDDNSEVTIKIKQSELDAIYKNMPWNLRNKTKKM